MKSPVAPTAAVASSSACTVEVLLESGPVAPRTARRAVREVLASRGWDEDRIFQAELVVSEMVTNAITHALPPYRLHLHVDDTPDSGLHVHVVDSGTNPHPTSWAAHRPPDEHGLGAHIINTLAAEAGITPNNGPDTLIDHWAALDAA